MPPAGRRPIDTHRPAPASRDAGSAAAALLYLMALLSGGAALIYEVTWARMLALTFGSTTLAASAVIAGFMGGMGLGARGYALVFRRATRPVVVYACLELGIALSTAILSRAFYSLPRLFAEMADVATTDAGLHALRFALVFVLLLVPSALMGATFPALCTVMIRSVRQVDRRLGMIYGVNTVGGALGVLVGGMFLADRFGLIGAVNIANVVNLLVAAVALGLRRVPAAGAAPIGEAAADDALPTALPRIVIGVVLFVSGFTTLAYEILWLRALRYGVGNNSYALSTVLVVFLLGLGLGSLLLTRVLRRGAPERALAVCQCAVGVLSLAGMAGLLWLLSAERLHDTVSIYSAAVWERAWWQRLLVDVGLATVVLLPATLAMGLSFPLSSRLFLGSVRRLGARVGGAYLLANLGSIAGAVAGAVLLLPRCGTLGGTKVLAVVNVGLGAAVLAALGRPAARTLAAPVVAAVVVALLAVRLPPAIPLRGEGILLGTDKGTAVFEEEGDQATVQVYELTNRPLIKTMTVDGYNIGWSAAWAGTEMYRKQVLLAHLPVVLDARIRHTLNVGLGSGTTLKTLAAYPDLETLDCVEISRSVARGCVLFPEGSVLSDPRFKLIVDDAVHYLLRSHKKYDAIISDGKQHPFYSGNAILLCREFYEYARDDLSEHGMFVQWIPGGTLATDFRTILRTMGEVFPYVEVFAYPRASILMVGSTAPLAGRPVLDAGRFAELTRDGAAGRSFIEHRDVLLAGWAASRDQFMPLVADAAPSTWDRLILDVSSFKAAVSEWDGAESANFSLLQAAARAPRPAGERSFDPGSGAYVQSANLMRQAWLEYFSRQFGKGARIAQQALRVNPQDRAAQAALRTMQQREAQESRVP
ncbi:MAG: fused MFS/spermidine synthase [Planctomycetes bacterium]|nr:fused MFS/spermidine synthase [Planctomycetota bacterium]